MTPREPDRYEAKAREVRQEIERCGFARVPAQLAMDYDELIAAALRAAESERDKEWAAAVRRKLAPHYPCRIDDVTPCPECAPLRALLRAMKPDPAAAPAAETWKDADPDTLFSIRRGLAQRILVALEYEAVHREASGFIDSPPRLRALADELRKEMGK